MIHLSISKAFESTWQYVEQNPGKVVLAVSGIFLLLFRWFDREDDSSHELIRLDRGRRMCWLLATHGLNDEHFKKAAIAIEKVIYLFDKPSSSFPSIMAARDELNSVLDLTSKMGIETTAIHEAKKIIDELYYKKIN